MKVGFERMGSLQAENALHQIFLFFALLNLYLFFTAKLLTIDFAIVSFWLKLLQRYHLLNHQQCSKTNETPLILGIPEITIMCIISCFFKETKPVFTKDSLVPQLNLSRRKTNLKEIITAGSSLLHSHICQKLLIQSSVDALLINNNHSWLNRIRYIFLCIW
jgi:hypothetical protein